MCDAARILSCWAVGALSSFASADGALCAGQGYHGYLDFELTSRFHDDWVEDIEIVGDIAYVACRDAGLRIVNISDPENMVVMSRYQTSGEALDVEYMERFGDKVVFVAGRGTGIDVLNVNEPTVPTQITSVTGFDAWEIDYFESIAGTPSLLVRNIDTLRFFDVSFAFSPILVGATTGNYGRAAFEIQRVDSRQYLYELTDSGDEVRISLIGGSYALTQIDTVSTSDSIAGMTVHGDHLYLGLDDRSFEVVELQPDRVGWSVVEGFELPFAASSLEVQGDELIASSFLSEFALMDVEFPDSPELTAIVQTLGRNRAIGRSGDVVLAGEEGVICAVDVSDPSVFNIDPVLGSYDFGSFDFGYGEIQLTTNDRAVVVHDNEIHLFDVSSNTPVHLDVMDDARWSIRAIDVVGDVCYVMDGDDFRAFDFSTGQFQQLSRISSNLLPHTSQDISVLGDVAYIAMGSRRLARVDVSDPANASSIPTGSVYNNLTQIEWTDAIEGGPHLFYLNDGDIAEPFNAGNEFGTKIALDHEGYAYYVHTEPNYNETHIAIYHPESLDVLFPPVPIHAIHRPLRFISYSQSDDVNFAFTPEHMLLSEYASGVTIYELGDRLELKLAGVIDGDWIAYGLATDGERAFIRTRESLIIADISGCAPPCDADLNGDGELNFFDVSAFLTAYNAQDPIADFTGDGSFNFFDVSAFLQAYNAGCP